MSTASHIPLLPEAKEMTPFDRQRTCEFLRSAGFYLTSRNPSVVQVELVSGYMHCLRPNTSSQMFIF